MYNDFILRTASSFRNEYNKTTTVHMGHRKWKACRTLKSQYNWGCND